MTEVVHVVTSCSSVGWEKYGERFVSTFAEHWPQSVALHVVSEDELPSKYGRKNMMFHRLSGSDSWQSFRAQYETVKWVHGDSASKRPQGFGKRWPDRSGYNFRFDAYKFSKKVFAIELIAEELRSGRLLWLDADTLTHAPVPEGLSDRMMPGAYAVSCLSRVGYHSECGFVGYNLEHHQALKFIRAFAELYTGGDVFQLAEWHDSWVFDWLRNKMMVATYNIPHKSKGHPFINSELGLYLDHLKGNRKNQGKSNLVEQVANINHPYWQGARRL